MAAAVGITTGIYFRTLHGDIFRVNINTDQKVSTIKQQVFDSIPESANSSLRLEGIETMDIVIGSKSVDSFDQDEAISSTVLPTIRGLGAIYVIRKV